MVATIWQILERLAILSAHGDVREKTNRTICYVLKLIEFELQQHLPQNPYIKPVKTLQSIFSEARRVYRQCKYFENIQSVVKAVKMTNSMTKYTAIGKHASMFVHHSLDQLILLRNAGFLKDINIELVKKRCMMGWFFSVVFGITGITYQILSDLQNQLKLIQKMKQINTPIEIQFKEYQDHNTKEHSLQNLPLMEIKEFTQKIEEEKSQLQKQIQLLQSKRRLLFLEFLKAFFDLPVAFEATYKKNYLNTDVVSVCGMISSLVGLYVVLPKSSPPAVVVVKT